jgi:uncharacterized membrane protein
MTGTLSWLTIAALVFLSTHLAASTPLREVAVAGLGERGWLAVFSLASIVELAWLVMAYRAAPHEVLWSPPAWAAWIPVLAMPVAFVSVVCGYLTPNPTAVMGEKHLHAPDPAPGILKMTRHPIMAGIALWALAHLAANGDIASVILFGAMAVLSILGMTLLDLKMEARVGAAWGPLALTTSAVPFLAALQGRTRIAWRGIGWWKVAAGLGLYGLFLFGHAHLIGVGPWPV